MRVSGRFRAFHGAKYPTQKRQKRACFKCRMRLKNITDPAYAFQGVSKRFTTFH
jgi:hypothetical protein